MLKALRGQNGAVGKVLTYRSKLTQMAWVRTSAGEKNWSGSFRPYLVVGRIHECIVPLEMDDKFRGPVYSQHHMRIKESLAVE